MIWPCSNPLLESCNCILRSPKSSRHDGIREVNFQPVGPRKPSERSRYKALELDDGATAMLYMCGENIFSYLFPPNRG